MIVAFSSIDSSSHYFFFPEKDLSPFPSIVFLAGVLATLNSPPHPLLWGKTEQPSHRLKLEKLFEYLDCLLRILDRMSDRTRILEDLVVVTALVRLVAEEMNFRVFDA